MALMTPEVTHGLAQAPAWAELAAKKLAAAAAAAQNAIRDLNIARVLFSFRPAPFAPSWRNLEQYLKIGNTGGAFDLGTPAQGISIT